MINDYSDITVQIRPLVVVLESQLDEKKIEDAQKTARHIENLMDELINWCYRQGR